LFLPDASDDPAKCKAFEEFDEIAAGGIGVGLPAKASGLATYAPTRRWWKTFPDYQCYFRANF